MNFQNNGQKLFSVIRNYELINHLRKKLIKVCNKNNFRPIFPEPELCGDNAAMIALVGLEKYKIKKFDNLDLPASPRLSLDKKAKFLKGAGVRL